MKTFRLFPLLILPLVLTSCVEFDKQSMAYRHDARGDRLLIFQVYERIHTDGEPTEGEKKELASVVNGQRTFFFANWIFEYDREAITKSLAEAQDQLQETSDVERRTLQARIEFFQQLLDSVRVDKGKFFLNDQSELCAYQGVVVTHVSRLINKANHSISAEVEFQLASAECEFSRKQKQHIRSFMQRDGRWVRFNGNQLCLGIPQTSEDYDDTAVFLQQLQERGQFVSYNDPFLDMRLGNRRTSRTVITLDNLNGDYEPTLLEHVRDDYTLANSLNIPQLRDSFLRRGKL